MYSGDTTITYENHGSNGNRSGEDFSWKNKKAKIMSVFNIEFDINRFDDRLFDSSDQEVSNFIGSRQKYYFRKFNQMKAENKSYSWNWAAFLFPVAWFAYRKMYLVAVLTALATWMVSSLFPSVWMGAMVVGVFWGLFANTKYLEYMQNEFIRAEVLRGDSRRRSYLLGKGGVSILALIVVIICYGGIL